MSPVVKDIIASIRGSEFDFTSGKISRAILLLAIPMFFEMVWESTFAIVDIFWVSRLGKEAIAVVGLTESVLNIVYTVAFGFSMGVTAVVARRIGEKNKDKAALSACQSIAIGIGFSIIMAIPGVLYAAKALELMGASENVIEIGENYTLLMFGGNVVIMLLFINNAIFRSAGDAALAMWALLVSNALNIALDPCFIFGWGPFPELGVTGAAVATNIGRGSAVIFQLWILFRGNARIHILKKHILLNLTIIKKLLNLSIGGIGQFMIATASWIFLYRILAFYGDSAIAGYTIGIRIILFTLLPSWGISNAASTLVGQNIGAGKLKRAVKSVWYTSYVNMAFLGLVAVILIAKADFWAGIFTTDPVVTRIAVLCLQIMGAGFILYALGMVMLQALNGSGDTKSPTIINFIAFWLIEIPLAYILAICLWKDELGIFLAILISESLMTLMGVFVILRGRWKYREL